MTVRLRASVIPGLLALTALPLTACASQGTIGASASGPTSTADSGVPSSGGTDSSAPSDPAAGSFSASVTQDPSALASSLKKLDSLWTDQGCKIALAGFGDYVTASQTGTQQGVAAIPGAEAKIRTGAQQTKKPEAAVEMNKMAADLQTIYTQAQAGQTPANGPLKSDFQVMGNVCSQP